MIGGQSNQMALLPCVSSGPARLVCAEKPDKTLGQRLAPASLASNQAPSEAITRKGVKA